MAGVVSFVWIRLPRADLWFGELQHPEHEVSHCFAGRRERVLLLSKATFITCQTGRNLSSSDIQAR